MNLNLLFAMHCCMIVRCCIANFPFTCCQCVLGLLAWHATAPCSTFGACSTTNAELPTWMQSASQSHPTYNVRLAIYSIFNVAPGAIQLKSISQGHKLQRRTSNTYDIPMFDTTLPISKATAFVGDRTGTPPEWPYCLGRELLVLRTHAYHSVATLSEEWNKTMNKKKQKQLLQLHNDVSEHCKKQIKPGLVCFC